MFCSSPVNLSYDVYDGKEDGIPLVFLHGLFGSKSNFHSIAKSLVQRTGRKVRSSRLYNLTGCRFYNSVLFWKTITEGLRYFPACLDALHSSYTTAICNEYNLTVLMSDTSQLATIPGYIYCFGTSSTRDDS